MGTGSVRPNSVSGGWDKKHTHFALGERVRTEAGPRQQVVAHLGELNADKERRWLRTVVFQNRQGAAQQLRLSPTMTT